MKLNERADQVILHVFKRFKIEVDHGQGVYLIDRNGKAYLDLLAGIAVNALGYNHPAVNEAILRQLNRNLHLSNYFVQDVQLDLAEKLIGLTPFSKIFFTNSGTEAIEGLLKLVKKWGQSRGKNEIIAFEGSFHGRSLGALSITMQPKYQKNFNPLIPNTQMVPFNDVSAFTNAVNENTAAIFYEGITGEGGIRPVSDEMMKAFREVREKYGCLVIADEIQSGVGRTGKFYYYEYHDDFTPDAVASAKAMGGGLPLGAFLVSPGLENVFDMGEHGTTYGGNPLACAAGLATINEISKSVFLQQIVENGAFFKSHLLELKDKYPGLVTEIRGRGLMLGMEMLNPDFAQTALNLSILKGLIFNIAGDRTLRFVPPLIINQSQIKEAIQILDSVLSEIN
jgi:predicted acetylornithine/succinylornithine family transaminase